MHNLTLTTWCCTLGGNENSMISCSVAKFVQNRSCLIAGKDNVTSTLNNKKLNVTAGEADGGSRRLRRLCRGGPTAAAPRGSKPSESPRKHQKLQKFNILINCPLSFPRNLPVRGSASAHNAPSSKTLNFEIK